MARVKCQILPRASQWTLIWSEGPAVFPPLVLEGEALRECRRLAAAAQEQLAGLGAVAGDKAAAAKAGYQLAVAGHALYRELFQLNHQPSGPAREIHWWFERLTRENGVESLEILDDTFTVPWTVLHDEAPDEAAFAQSGPEGAAWKGFWGRRFNMTGGRRIPRLPVVTPAAAPALLLAIDPATRAELPQEEQQRLSEFQASREMSVTESCDGLGKAILSREIDVLYVFGRADKGGIHLGEQRLTAAMLKESLIARTIEEGEGPGPVLVLNTCNNGEQGNVLAAFAGLATSGLMGTLQPVVAPVANRQGLELLAQVLAEGVTHAGALQRHRQQNPMAGLFYFGCCPEFPATAEELSLPEQPYQPLAPLGIDEAALLVGREIDTANLATLLDDPAVRLVLVHGPAGVGKASLLRAGVLPCLEDQSVGYQFMRDRTGEDPVDDERDYPVCAIRATNDLAGQLAQALGDFCCRPYKFTTPTSQTVTVDLPSLLCQAAHLEPGQNDTVPSTSDLRQALREDLGLLGEILTAITAPLPFELVMLIEHGEELFSLAPADDEGQESNLELEMLRAACAGSARAKLIVSLQTQYLGRCLEPLLQGAHDRNSVRTFLVPELTEDDILEVILQPTATEPLPGTSEVPQKTYGYQFEQGLPEQIASEARKPGGENQVSTLVLVHAICSRLYRTACAQPDKVIRQTHLKEIGGVANGLSNYVTSMISSIPARSARKSLGQLLQKLVVRHEDGSATSKLRPVADVVEEWSGGADFSQTVSMATDDKTRLLSATQLNVNGKEGIYLSLGHDALAPAIASQAGEAAKKSYGRSKLIDALWVTIPLLLLAGVVIWNRHSTVRKQDEELKAMEKALQTNQRRVRSMRWPAYTNQIRSAEAAIAAGDMIRAEQALVAVKPLPEDASDDMRGFDWYHLWQRMHQDQLTVDGNRGTVNGVALTPDGQVVATASAGGVVRICSVGSGKELATFELKDKNGPVAGQCLAFSPEGNLLAGGSSDGVIRLWKVGLVSPEEYRNVAALVASLPTNLWPAARMGQLVVRSTPPSIVALDPLTEHQGAVQSIAFKADGKTMVSAGKDGTIKLWDLAAQPPKVTATLTEHGSVLAVAFSPDGKLLASAGADSKVVIWDTSDNSKKATLEAQDVKALAWTPDGKTLATGGAQNSYLLEAGIIKLWDTLTWKEQPAPSFAVAPVFALAFLDDGKVLAAASKHNVLQALDVATGQERLALRGHVGWVCALAVARGGEVIATGSYDGKSKVWLPRQQQERSVLKASTDPVCAAVFSPNDRWLATGSADGMIKLWNTETASEVKALKAHTGAVLAITWSGDGKSLISGGADGKLKLWDVAPASSSFGVELDAVAAHTKEVTSLCWTPMDSRFPHGENNRFASGSLDGTAKVWQVVAGKFATDPVLIKADNAVTAVYYLQKPPLLVTGHEDGKIFIWNADLGKLFSDGTWTGHSARVTGLAMALLEQEDRFELRFISTSTDRTIKFWSLRSASDYYTLRGHGAPVTCLALALTQGHSLVTGSADNTVKIWDPLSQEERLTLKGQTSAVRAVAIAGNGLTIACACQDGTVHLYRATSPHGPR
jgi:WD40 repeat protein